MMVMTVLVVMIMGEMHVELHTGNALPLLPRDMQVVAVEFQLGEFSFQFSGVYAEINQRADEHIAADAAENVEVQGLHLTLTRNLTLNLPVPD